MSTSESNDEINGKLFVMTFETIKKIHSCEVDFNFWHESEKMKVKCSV